MEAESDSPDRPDEPDLIEPPARRARRWVPLAVLAAVTLVLGGVSVGLNRLAGSGPGPAGGGAAGRLAIGRGTVKGQSYACIQVGAPGLAARPDGNSCARQASDHFRRTELSPADRQQVLTLSRDVEGVVIGAAMLAPCRGQSAQPCPPLAPVPAGSPVNGSAPVAVPAPQLPTAATVDLVRRALLDERYADVTVRLARADDPAPAGAVLWAVRAGPGCVIGFRSPGGAGSVRVEGPLPDGHCLTR